jgi:molybdate transport system substrate-binding protein
MRKQVAKLKVMCARSMHDVVGRLAADFDQASGHEIGVSFGTVGALQKRLDAGETADVLIIGAPAMNKLIQAGAVDPASRADIAITSVGIAVRAGATAPDMSTPDTFKQALINARSVAFSDAAVGGSAGVYLAKLFVEMGIADEIARKAMPQQSGGEVATRVANGEADIGMTLIAEILPINGARVLGPLPAPLGNDTTYAAAVMRASAAPAAAAAFIAALRQPDARAGWEAAGFSIP